MYSSPLRVFLLVGQSRTVAHSQIGLGLGARHTPTAEAEGQVVMQPVTHTNDYPLRQSLSQAISGAILTVSGNGVPPKVEDPYPLLGRFEPHPSAVKNPCLQHGVLPYTQSMDGRPVMSWPTTNDPRTEFVTMRFTVSEAADIDWLIGHMNAKSRSAAVRDCVDRVVAVEKKRAKKQRVDRNE